MQSLKDELQAQGTVRFTVRARPGAAQSRIMEVMSDGSVKIAVAAPPEGGRANAELLRFLAEEFAVHKQQVRLLAGQGSREKLVLITRDS